MRSARVGAGAGEERGEGAGGFGFGGGEPGRERQLVDADARGEVGEFGEQRGVGEQRGRQEAGGSLAGGRVEVVPEVRGQGVGEPGVDVGLDVAAGSPGEFVPDSFVSGAGLGLLQRAEFAQRLELVGAGRDPGGFAQLGFPGVGGRGVGGELGLDDVVGVRVVDGACGRGGEQLVEAFPFRELRRAAGVVGQVLVPGRLPGVEPGFLEGCRDGAGVHALRPAPYDPAADAGRVDRLAGHRDARGERSTGTAAGRPHPGHLRPRIRGEESERAAARALYDDLPDCFIAGPEFDRVRTGTRSPGRA